MINAAFLNDPYPCYHALRAEAALHWSEEFCGGAWLATGYADVAMILRDTRFSVRRAGGWINSSGPQAQSELRQFKRIFLRSLLFMDAPQHTRRRQVMLTAFKSLTAPPFAQQVQTIVDNLLDKISAQASNLIPGQYAQFDFIRDFACELPALVMANILGIAPEDRSEFVFWSNAIAAFIGSPTPTMEIAFRAQSSLASMDAYFSGLLAQRRAALGEDLISQLIRAEATGAIITHKELLAQCCTLLFAGHETTRNLLGNGMLALLQHPLQWQALQAQPSLLPSALRELLRFDSPVQYTGRRLKVDCELHGQRMKQGDLVIPLIGAANRDPAKFIAPDSLDLQRNQGAHLSFGYGPHVCIGATLTYLEAEIALRSIMQRLPQLQLTLERPVWGDNAVYRSLHALPVRWLPTISRLAAYV